MTLFLNGHGNERGVIDFYVTQLCSCRLVCYILKHATDQNIIVEIESKYVYY